MNKLNEVLLAASALTLSGQPTIASKILEQLYKQSVKKKSYKFYRIVDGLIEAALYEGNDEAKIDGILETAVNHAYKFDKYTHELRYIAITAGLSIHRQLVSTNYSKNPLGWATTKNDVADVIDNSVQEDDDTEELILPDEDASLVEVLQDARPKNAFDLQKKLLHHWHLKESSAYKRQFGEAYTLYERYCKLAHRKVSRFLFFNYALAALYNRAPDTLYGDTNHYFHCRYQFRFADWLGSKFQSMQPAIYKWPVYHEMFAEIGLAASMGFKKTKDFRSQISPLLRTTHYVSSLVRSNQNHPINRDLLLVRVASLLSHLSCSLENVSNQADNLYVALKSLANHMTKPDDQITILRARFHYHLNVTNDFDQACEAYVACKELLDAFNEGKYEVVLSQTLITFVDRLTNLLDGTKTETHGFTATLLGMLWQTFGVEQSVEIDCRIAIGCAYAKSLELLGKVLDSKMIYSTVQQLNGNGEGRRNVHAQILTDLRQVMSGSKSNFFQLAPVAKDGQFPQAEKDSINSEFQLSGSPAKK